MDEEIYTSVGPRTINFSLYCDSQNAIHLSKNSMFHPRSKYIDVRYYWTGVLELQKLQLEKIYTNKNGSDITKKTLLKEKLVVCREITSMR